MVNKEIEDTIKGFILNESFSIEPLSTITFKTGQPYRPDYNLILFVTKGKAVLLLDGERIEVLKNSLLLISKGQVYCFLENADNGYLLKFGNCFWDKTPISASNCKAVLFDSGTGSRQFLLNPANLAEFTSLFITTLNDFEGPNYANKPDALAAYLKIIIIKIANIHALLQENTGTYDTKLYQNFTAMVHEHFNTEHNVSAYAKKLGVSSRKLYDVCKAAGSGGKEIISEQLVSEAKRLLQFTSRPIKEIAMNLGFATPYQFSNFFKKHSGHSPVEYRQLFVEIGI